ncbi:conserved hypothetical protein [Pyrobaculum islandicum DSM 4184]|uniref:Uncharacterized protein n=1 Tax=Pyrobaculum islandicum (strain DSM 4184 / JCM 9189 / GEO3) TaxID=384616 RepID=A1RRX5_PYRIL|nr:hypothetical protein [Pyrobaculum islandicum]ABL87707.1 conserved hypothetical protein [Pyrobaculum islandicum DSM 4184]
MSAHNVVVGIISEALVDLLKRMCECEKLKELHVKDFELAKVADEVTKAISEGREGDFGPVVVRLQKKFLGRREIKVWLFGREIDVDSLLSEISKAKSRVSWLLNDCSDQALIETLYKYEDRYLIEVVQRNFNEIRKVCSREVPKLVFGDVPTYVIEGVTRGIETYLSK